MSEITNNEEVMAPATEDEVVAIELNDEARVAFALYLEVMQGGKVSKKGTKIPLLSTQKISKKAEVSPKQVSKSFDRLRNKGFIINDENGDLYIPDILVFEDWLKSEGAVID
jgi:hypothetical protein